MHIKQGLCLIRKFLQYENISEEERNKYEKEKVEIEKILNNDDNSVGNIVGEVRAV